MSVQDPIRFDLIDLTRAMAEEAMGEDFYRWYREFPGKEGHASAEGFLNWEYLIRPGVTINTDHLVFIMDRNTGHRVAVDTYGDIFTYTENNPTTRRLASIIADAKNSIIAREEVGFVEATDHVHIPDLSVRMAL